MIKVKLNESGLWAIRDGRSGLICTAEECAFHGITTAAIAIDFIKSTRPNLRFAQIVPA